VSLVLVGKEDYFYKKLKTTVRENKIQNIIFTDFIPDIELDVIYKNSLFYIFPSLYEGFGLPPLEAMMRKIPVASSNHPCMKEILDENAYFFDAAKKENITKAITEFYENQELRKQLAERGVEWARRYNWNDMAKKTIDIYKSIIF
jgi:glycosyltransferase involved in cell wall biosynthesis